MAEFLSQAEIDALLDIADEDDTDIEYSKTIPNLKIELIGIKPDKDIFTKELLIYLSNKCSRVIIDF